MISAVTACASYGPKPGSRLACTEPASATAPAAQNMTSLYALEFAPFGRVEHGWAIYAPAVEHEVGSLCPADTPGFAAALARWQAGHGLPADGAMTPKTFAAMKAAWQGRRPFVRLRAAGVCPVPPPESRLAAVPAGDKADARPVELRAGALKAYQRMVRDARRSEPTIGADPLLIFSGYRSPDYDAARCAEQQNCNGVVRAECSAHRTGLALDLVLDSLPGQPVDSSADVNRLAMVNGLAYRWLVANAARYGFVPYVFEPWHWEWTGEPP